jgi:hypothetical protein
MAVYAGEAEALSFPRSRTALIYSGLDEWAFEEASRTATAEDRRAFTGR